MKTRRTELETMMKRAVELRCRGSSWEAVAKEVERSVATVRDWPTKHVKFWRQTMQAAKRELDQEAMAESLQTLRLQLRSDDEKASRDAATAILKFAKATPKPKKATKESSLSPEIQAIAEFVQELSDEEIHQLLQEVPAADHPPASDASPENAAPPTSPAAE